MGPCFLSRHATPRHRWRNKGADGEGGDDEEVLVNIESPAANIRRISSSIVINRPPSDVWRILTDYDK